MREIEKKSECGCEMVSSKAGVEPASCELEQNKNQKKMEDQTYLPDSVFYNKKKTNRRCPSNAPQTPKPELMKSVHPGAPPFTEDPPGFLDPLVRGDAGSNTSLGPVRDSNSFQCQNRSRSPASSLQNVSSSSDEPANRSRARTVMKGDKVDKRSMFAGIKVVSFASVHSLGADIVALIAEDASTDAQPDRRSVDPLVSAPSPAAAAEDAKTIDPKIAVRARKPSRLKLGTRVSTQVGRPP